MQPLSSRVHFAHALAADEILKLLNFEPNATCGVILLIFERSKSLQSGARRRRPAVQFQDHRLEWKNPGTFFIDGLLRNP
jgi:hypothetical protein